MKTIWNIYARSYEVINKNIPYVEMLDDVLQAMKLEPHQKVLDVGCGTGNLLKKIHSADHSVKAMGVDDSPKMLEIAKTKLKNARDIDFKQMKVEDELREIKDGSYNRVVSVNAVYAFNDPAKVIAEMYRITMPGGRVVIANPHNKASSGAVVAKQRKILGTGKFLLETLKNMPALLGVLLVNVLFLRRNDHYLSQDQLRDIFQKLGFVDIKTSLTYADQDVLISGKKCVFTIHDNKTQEACHLVHVIQEAFILGKYWREKSCYSIPRNS